MLGVRKLATHTLNKGVGFFPMSLGPALYDMWDAERASTISISGAAVTAWRSVKNSWSAAQAVAAARPTYSSTIFGGRPGVVFDGADDELAYFGTGLPSGGSPCEIWALVDQTAPASDASNRRVFGYGSGNNNDSRQLLRSVTGGVNRLQAIVGTGNSATSATNTAVDFSGRHVLRSVFGSTTTRADIDGIPSSNTIAEPSTIMARARIGAAPIPSAASYFRGVISLVAVTSPLTDTEAAKMLVFLKDRGGI